jgi:membrane protein YdbS with pleckstrin-like domain
MKGLLLRFLHVTERPDPPPGSEPTLTVFRASERYFYLSAVGWLFKQVGALVGLLFSIVIFSGGVAGFAAIDSVREWMDGIERVRVGPLEVEGELLDVVSVIELFAFGAFVVQFLIGAALLRLRWEMHWYMVSDESLRIREGLWRIHEQTMTVANIQNMAVRQGPILRLFGLADLEVQTAGGGSTPEGQPQGKSMHVGRFRGIEDAEALRDRLRRALARHRDAGLGDPEDVHDLHDSHDHEGGARVPAAPAPSGGDLLAAAEALREEARALRASAQAAYG